MTRLSPIDSPVYALLRESAEGKDRVLVLVNNDLENEQKFSLATNLLSSSEEVTLSPSPRGINASRPPAATLAIPRGDEGERDGVRGERPTYKCDLLGQSLPELKRSHDGAIHFNLKPGAAFCLSATDGPQGLSGDAYRRARAQAAFALTALSRLFAVEAIGPCDWRSLAQCVHANPRQFLASLFHLDRALMRVDLRAALLKAGGEKHFPKVVTWTPPDAQRIVLVPPEHWLLLQDAAPFRAALNFNDGGQSQPAQSIQVRDGHVTCFAPRPTAAHAELVLERFATGEPHVVAAIRYLSPLPDVARTALATPHSDDLVLLTNGLGGMARMCVDLGCVNSKYDCVLGANLHPTLPVDRHIFVKRVRVWVNADGFITPLNGENLVAFEAGPPAGWRFVANAGDARSVEIHLRASMVPQRNTTVLCFQRPPSAPPLGKDLPAQCDVRLTVRFDIEDRNFHTETHRNGGADHHFTTHTHPLDDQTGFAFTPAIDRQLRVFSDGGLYHAAEEWSENIPHPVEQSRGQTASGDAWSPGWFDLPIPKGESVTLVITAETDEPATNELPITNHESPVSQPGDAFAQQLARAARAFVVRRNGGKTVIAGYPWFLDWGRDSLICARGLLAAGLIDEVTQLLVTFARFEENGTLPNTLNGDNASNRDTSDAPLWFGIVCEETAAATNATFYETKVDKRGRTIADVLRSIGVNYKTGTQNGIRMDAASGLIWSPSHFTWMDTNFPACTPREGYPVEIQVLWIRLLRLLERLRVKPDDEAWGAIADRAEASLHSLYWLEDGGYLADSLVAKAGQPARSSPPDNSLRSNYLLAVSLGLVNGERAQRCVDAALRHLVVPGALRSLAPLPVSPPLPIHSHDGKLLNNPIEPYWGRYEGDEDTRRKPAYHNGTAWTWTFPIFCEALARAWDFSPAAVAATKAYLGSLDRLMAEGCLGHLPEILDGDAPHQPRGCDAQAWGVTEALRVWKLLNEFR
ncbi:MAG: glycogen debranching enzyme family protein [Verrucomicrobia bacterium]|nr:glycogen debranching enzyme family protein [Verrucomicrobiota bacterium]